MVNMSQEYAGLALLMLYMFSSNLHLAQWMIRTWEETSLLSPLSSFYENSSSKDLMQEGEGNCEHTMEEVGAGW